MEIKKPTSFDQQIQLLKKRGLKIDNNILCKQFLKSINYYRFTAYLLPFKNPDGSYKEGANFETVYKMYHFDRKMRTVLFGVIEEIELFLRTQLAYYHSHKYNPLGYLEPSNFNDKHKHEHYLKILDDAILNNRSTLVVKHHKEKYGGKFPLWVIIEFFSMGMLSYFYSDMHLQDKKYIARNIFNTTYKNLDSWLRCITDLRNKCAHYSRLYYWRFPALPAIPNSIGYKATGRLFDQILMLKFLHPNNTNWNNSIALHIEALIDRYNEYIKLDHVGFPNNWQEHLFY